MDFAVDSSYRERELLPLPLGPTSATADPAAIFKLKFVKIISLGRLG